MLYDTVAKDKRIGVTSTRVREEMKEEVDVVPMQVPVMMEGSTLLKIVELQQLASCGWTLLVEERSADGEEMKKDADVVLMLVAAMMEGSAWCSRSPSSGGRHPTSSSRQLGVASSGKAQVKGVSMAARLQERLPT